MLNIMDAAKYLIYLSYNYSKHSLTPLKLQKLLYLAQGWSYVWDDSPLFPEEFVAWQYGPVNLEVYEYFNKYGRNEIPEEEGDVLRYKDINCKKTLEAIWDGYGATSAFELVDLTHSQKPWIDANNNDTPISNEEIRKYFQSVYR